MSSLVDIDESSFLFCGRKAAGSVDAGLDKSLKDLDAVGILRSHVFRMPLYAPGKAAARQTDAFNQAVRRSCHDCQTGSQFPDGLMVTGVDADGGLSQQGMERTARNQFHRVGGGAIGLALGMLDLRGALAGQILPQGTAHHHIEELQAPADAQHRLFGSQCGTQQTDLQFVPDSNALAAYRQTLGMVPGGINILTAGEDQAVTELHHPVDRLVIILEREHQRQTPCLSHSSHIVGQHPVAVQFCIHQRGDSNHRSHENNLLSICRSITAVVHSRSLSRTVRFHCVLL